MFISQTSQYALRAMTGIVNSESSDPVSSKELAEYSDVPSHYLSKIMRKMVEAGFVKSQKGHGGGFILNIDPKELTIIDVLKAVGFNAEDQPCVFGYEKCDDNKPCPLHPVWKKFRNSFNEWAFETTFEDVRKEAALINQDKFYKEV